MVAGPGSGIPSSTSASEADKLMTSAATTAAISPAVAKTEPDACPGGVVEAGSVVSTCGAAMPSRVGGPRTGPIIDPAMSYDTSLCT